MANARRRAHRSKAYKTRRFRNAIEGAAANAVRPTPRMYALSGLSFSPPRLPQGYADLTGQEHLDAEAKHEANHEADRVEARLRLTKLLRGLAPQNLAWALTHKDDLIRETALTGLARTETK